LRNNKRLLCGKFLYDGKCRWVSRHKKTLQILCDGFRCTRPDFQGQSVVLLHRLSCILDKKLKKYHQEISNIVAAAFSGLLLTAAFPKIGLDGIAWFALVPLLVILRNRTPGQGFRLGFIAGLVHYISLTCWLTDTMQTYGGLPVYAAFPLLFLLGAYLAIYPALWAAGVAGLTGSHQRFLIVPPVLWVGLEYLRSVLLTGFPWELLGYSQYKHLHLIQISDIFSVYGISFLIILCNTALATVMMARQKQDWAGVLITKRMAAIAAGVAGLALVLTLGYGAWRIHDTDRRSLAAPRKKVAVVQGNIEQNVKWEPEFRLTSTEKYVRLSVSTLSDEPELVVWPETAAPFYFLHDEVLTRKVMAGIRQTRAWFVIGSPFAEARGNRLSYYNSAWLVSPDMQVKGRYDKVHLVPFGEYVPLQKWLPFIEKIVQQVGDFSTGKKGDTLSMNGLRLGVLICYEGIFPDLAGAAVRNGAGLLVNITNDAWYGLSSAPYQHFSMAVFRAVENHRALIRSANTGISGFIDPAGRIMGQTPLFEDATLTRSLPVLDIQTIYTRFGDWFAGSCTVAGFLLLLAAFGRRRSGRRK